jgi:sporulation protein YlmC with PRC-barrel domain
MDMSIIKLARIIGTAGIVVAVPLLAATAQTQTPPPSPTNPPAATKPETSAMPSTTSIEKKAAAPAATGELVGLTAKSSDGRNLGTVQTVTMEPSGKISAIGVKVGGFLGFGAHTVAIPDGKFNRVGDTVQINMTADEVNKLAEAKKHS